MAATAFKPDTEGYPMKKTVLVCFVFLAVASAVFAQPGGGPKGVHEHLDGYQEDPLVISTNGRGEFNGRIANDGASFAYELKYRDLEGDITQAHIHLGGHSQSGGIIVFLCTNLGNGPAGTQACPDSPATITGTIVAANILTPASPQGLTAGEFAEFLRALRADSTYVNVHTGLWPGGEIRANIARPGKPHDHKH